MRSITGSWIVTIGVMALLAVGIACAGGTETESEAAQQPAVAAPAAAEPTAAPAEQMASPEACDGRESQVRRSLSLGDSP